MGQAYYTRSFEEEVTSDPIPLEETPPAVTTEAVYAFDGYTIEVNQKVMLIANPLSKPYG